MSITRSCASTITTIASTFAIACLALFAAGIASGADPARHAQEDPEATPVSTVAPRFGTFAFKADPLPQRDAVASKGDCAPRYRKAGAVGTCIADQPCRGFGVLENGRAVCACYARRGGCSAEERCETRGAQCVKDEDSEPLGRSN